MPLFVWLTSGSVLHVPAFSRCRFGRCVCVCVCVCMTEPFGREAMSGVGRVWGVTSVRMAEPGVYSVYTLPFGSHYSLHIKP